ncbi:MAG: RNA-binding protein [Methylococcales bacterium]|nr:RNA-binding protein [Methylococcales bacterium]MBT7443094.1 RNA-binding protein [Methylococcales bacterium]
MTVNAYKPSSQPAASKPQQKPANSNNNSNNSNQAADADAEPSDITTLFVGNLAFKANRHELNKLFSEYGLVHSVRLMTDRQTRKPRGFGFVEMASCDTAATIEALNDYEFFGRQLRVNEANERKPRT